MSGAWSGSSRAVENSPPARRAEVLTDRLYFYVDPSRPVLHPALDGEDYDAYCERTRGSWGEWFATRITESGRIKKALRRKPRQPIPTSDQEATSA